LTLNRPKVLLSIGSETILERSIRLLRESGIRDILIVVGYMHDVIRKTLGQSVDYQLNPFFADTNNMASLWFAKEWVQDAPFVYLHGDIVYAPELLGLLCRGNIEDAALLVDYGPTDEEAMKVRVEGGRFIESNKNIPPDKAMGEWVGIAVFKHPHVLFDMIETLLKNKHFQAYDTLAFTEMAREGTDFAIISTDNYPWVEVDTESDLERARRLFG